MSLPLPSPLWQWHFDHQEQWLCISLDDRGTLQTGTARKNMKDANFQFAEFSVTDTQLYVEMAEELERSDLSAHLRFAFVTLINGIAIVQMHKEIRVKNWLFRENQDAPVVLDSRLMNVRSDIGSADVLVLHADQQYCLCMLLQDLKLEQGKSLRVFQPVKVSYSRLFPFCGTSIEEFKVTDNE